MANLIITVIAIALVAVASLMGAYYGGAAFLNNQSAAQASTVMNEGQQIAGAWIAYLNDNGNTPPSDVNLLVTNNYIDTWPQYPAGPGPTPANSIVVAQITFVNGTIHYYAISDMGASGGAIATDRNAAACNRIVKLNTSNTVTAAVANWGSFALGGPGGNGLFGNSTSGCALPNGAGPGTFTVQPNNGVTQTMTFGGVNVGHYYAYYILS